MKRVKGGGLAPFVALPSRFVPLFWKPPTKLCQTPVGATCCTDFRTLLPSHFYFTSTPTNRQPFSALLPPLVRVSPVQTLEMAIYMYICVSTHVLNIFSICNSVSTLTRYSSSYFTGISEKNVCSTLSIYTYKNDLIESSEKGLVENLYLLQKRSFVKFINVFSSFKFEKIRYIA